MEGVFSYFVAIGAGLTTGIAVIFLPVAWLLNKMKRKGGKEHGTIRK